MRRYNHPVKEEVAAVFVAEDGAPPGYRDMVLWPRAEGEPVHRVDDAKLYIDYCQNMNIVIGHGPPKLYKWSSEPLHLEVGLWFQIGGSSKSFSINQYLFISF